MYVLQQELLGSELSRLLAGWSAYYRGLVSPQTMRQYDDQVLVLLVAWAVTQHPEQDRDWLLQHYWRHVGKDDYRFAAPNGPCLMTHSSLVKPRKHHKKRGTSYVR
jgi:RNA-directed DNA polymerase